MSDDRLAQARAEARKYARPQMLPAQTVSEHREKAFLDGWLAADATPQPRAITRAQYEEAEKRYWNYMQSKGDAAIRAVLDQHQQADYQRHVPRMLRRTPEDHLPYRPCDGCREEWPCTTVKAITAALTSHQHPTPPGSSGKCDHEARGVTWAEGDTTCYVCETCEHEWTEEGG